MSSLRVLTDGTDNIVGFEPPSATQAGWSFRPGLRTQAATLLVLIAILVCGLLGAIAVAYRSSDITEREQHALLTWRYESARVDSIAAALTGDLFQWNNSLLAKDPQGAKQQQAAAEGHISSLESLVAQISALQLPSDAETARLSYRTAAASLTDFATRFIAAGVHPDADVQVEVGAADQAWQNAAAPVDPFINSEVTDNQALQDVRRAYVYEMLGFGVVVTLVLLLLLALLQFHFTLGPIVRMAGVANILAARRPATIKATSRQDEIGQLTRALAAWQQNTQNLVTGLRDMSSQAVFAASTLSTASEELASTTLEQTTAATATSASMEELARSSVSIADTIDRVAIQTGEVRANLELAQTDLRASGDRTLALAGRVNEIEGILELINDIADQTNLLALNAAIEAARAGDAGRGFAVVADEVRRLAERSKAAAAQIAKLVEGAQTSSSETVMALEKSGKQMERGLAMMQEMAEVSSQVQVATQEQRTSTGQAVLAIAQIALGNRSVAATAQDISSAAADQAQLASALEAMAGTDGDSPKSTGSAPGREGRLRSAGSPSSSTLKVLTSR
jgi:methyl-accepting chemotaxis protein